MTEPMTDAKIDDIRVILALRRRYGADTSGLAADEAESLLARLAAERSRADAAEAARDAALARAMPTWQPIETAPHGEPVLLYCPDRGPTNRERIELGYASHGSRNEFGSTVSHHAWATMWRPLPDLPIPPAPATTETTP